MKKKGLTVSNFENKFDLSNYDSDNNLELNINEFKGLLTDLEIVSSLNDNQIRKLFSFLDENDSGSITLKEFKNKLKTV